MKLRLSCSKLDRGKKGLVLISITFFLLASFVLLKYEESTISSIRERQKSTVNKSKLEKEYGFDSNDIFKYDCTQNISAEEINYTLQKVLEAEINPSPFPHVYIQNFYHPRMYNCLMLNLPTQKNSSWMPDLSSERPRKYITFHSLSKESVQSNLDGLISARFWSAYAEKLAYSQQLADAFIQKFLPVLKLRTSFAKQLKGSYSWTTNLVRDGGPKYYINPHPDGPNKLVSTLFYLAKDEKNIAYGTGLFTFAGLEKGTKKRLYKLFKNVQYIPNSLLAYAPCHDSFHGVNRGTVREGDVRNTIQGFIKANDRALTKSGEIKIGPCKKR